MKRLAGKSALTTGAARGIGRGFADVYVHSGVRRVVVDIGYDAGVNNTLMFLGSPESDYTVSQTYNVDGGQWMS